MAQFVIEDVTLFNIGNAVREKTGNSELILVENLADVISSIPSTTESFNSGKQEEWSTFWEVYQKGGTRTEYERAFWGENFNWKNFYPKYDIAPVGYVNQRMFYNWGNSTNESRSLTQRLKDCGVVLDTSGSTYISQMFSYGLHAFTEIPTIDTTGCASRTSTAYTEQIFYRCSGLVTIEKIIISKTVPISNWFYQCSALENVVFEGEIGMNGLDVSPCTLLTHDSLMSIINALYDYSTDTSSTTHTVTLGATNLAKLTDAEKAIATGKGWTLA